MTPARVVIVDDHAIVREGLRAVLAYHDDLEVVGDAEDGEQAMAVVAATAPDVVLMDLAMPRLGGIEATGLLCAAHPGIRVVVLTQHDDWRYVAAVMRAGAVGYVMKRSVGSELVAALRAVLRGQIFVDRSIASSVVAGLSGRGGAGGGAALTARERDVLRLMASGHTGPQIAERLFLSVKTVSWHRTNIMTKLDLHSTAALVRYAIDSDVAAEGRPTGLADPR